MVGLGESHWFKVDSASDDSTFAWSWQQKVVTMPRLPSSMLSGIRTAIGTISPLIFWLLPEMNSTPDCLHIDGDDKWVKSLSDTIQNWRAPERQAHRWTSTPLLVTTVVKKDLLESPCSIWISLIVASGKKETLLGFCVGLSFCCILDSGTDSLIQNMFWLPKTSFQPLWALHQVWGQPNNNALIWVAMLTWACLLAIGAVVKH